MEKTRKGKGNCCLRLCKNTYATTTDKIKFYSFPASEYKVQQRQKWKQWVQKMNGQTDWEPTKGSRICSAHFAGNCPSSIVTSPSYAPCIIGQRNDEIRQTKEQAIRRFERFIKRRNRSTQVKDNVNSLSEATSSAVDTTFETSRLIESSMCDAGNVCSFKVDKEVQVEIFPIAVQQSEFINQIRTFICTLYVHNDICEASTQVFTPRNAAIFPIAKKILSNDKCCGPRILQSEKAVGPDDPGSTECSTGFHGISSVKFEQEILDLGGVTLPTFNLLLKALPNCKFRKISRENRLLIFLTKMKTGLTFAAISVLFRIHPTTVSRIFATVLQVLRKACNKFIFWPCREVVQNTMPDDFKPSYRDCRVIIDCTEMKLEQPSSIRNRVYTYSQYKKNFTAKILVGCTPGGFISFISKCYAGRTSDCQITTQSGILDLLEPGDIVLADKGFPGIQTVLDENGKGALVVMPPFLHDGHFSAEEVDKTYEIARVRIHIERIMQRLRVYKVMDKFSIDMLRHADDIAFMCGVLVNLQPPIIKDGDIVDPLIADAD